MRVALKYHIDPARRMARITYCAVPTFDQWADLVRSVFADPAWQPGFGLLFDRRPIDEPPSTSFVRRLADFCKRNVGALRGSRIALLVSSPAAFGMGRMEGQLLTNGGPEHSVFTAEEEALSWLAAPEDG